jgi:hypothetical protein
MMSSRGAIKSCIFPCPPSRHNYESILTPAWPVMMRLSVLLPKILIMMFLHLTDFSLLLLMTRASVVISTTTRTFFPVRKSWKLSDRRLVLEKLWKAICAACNMLSTSTRAHVCEVHPSRSGCRTRVGLTLRVP